MAGGHAIVNTLYYMWLIATLVASTTDQSNAHNLIMAARKRTSKWLQSQARENTCKQPMMIGSRFAPDWLNKNNDHVAYFDCFLGSYQPSFTGMDEGAVNPFVS